MPIRMAVPRSTSASLHTHQHWLQPSLRSILSSHTTNTSVFETVCAGRVLVMQHMSVPNALSHIQRSALLSGVDNKRICYFNIV